MTDATYYQHERYRTVDHGAGLRRAYYVVKPLLPRRAQLALRRAYAPMQARTKFPAWPIEPVLVQQRDAELLAAVRATGGEPVAFVNYWPGGARCAVVLTHDVEGPAGIENIMRVIDVERRHGFVSSWNFVAEWYDIPDGLFDKLRAAGCEIGVHGIRHDGKLFSSRAHFEAALPQIAAYAQRWGAVGFRSPATHRHADWMAELPVAYDSSFPDTDPFEPQAGGCCSILPFRFGDVVELPITLVQDHTLWEILREPGIDRWVEKTAWIHRHHGLINVIVHPDYVIEQERLDRYETFLAYLAGLDDAWRALPCDVAAWWREREALEIRDGAVHGETRFAATVSYARERDGELVIDV